MTRTSWSALVLNFAAFQAPGFPLYITNFLLHLLCLCGSISDSASSYHRPLAPLSLCALTISTSCISLLGLCTSQCRLLTLYPSWMGKPLMCPRLQMSVQLMHSTRQAQAITALACESRKYLGSRRLDSTNSWRPRIFSCTLNSSCKRGRSQMVAANRAKPDSANSLHSACFTGAICSAGPLNCLHSFAADSNVLLTALLQPSCSRSHDGCSYIC